MQFLCRKFKNTILILWLLGCKTGSFGFDCNETCGHCSEVNHCSDIDGICQTGCKAGYQGDLCRSCW